MALARAEPVMTTVVVPRLLTYAPVVPVAAAAALAGDIMAARGAVENVEANEIVHAVVAAEPIVTSKD